MSKQYIIKVDVEQADRLFNFIRTLNGDRLFCVSKSFELIGADLCRICFEHFDGEPLIEFKQGDTVTLKNDYCCTHFWIKKFRRVKGVLQCFIVRHSGTFRNFGFWVNVDDIELSARKETKNA